MSKSSSSAKRRFSIPWFVGVGLFHLMATLAFLEVYLDAYKASFIEDTSSEMAVWRGIMWMWTPFAMAAGGLEADDGRVVMGFAGAGSLVVAIVAGFLAPKIGGWIYNRLYPSSAAGERTESARAGMVVRVARRVFPIGMKRRTAVLVASVLIVTELVCGGWLFHRLIVAHNRSFSIRDSIRFRPISSGILHASSFTLYEGLPHQFYEGEKLAEELASKAAVKIRNFPFYERPLVVDPQDVEALRRLAASSSSFWSYGGPKLCGGFHPDYCLAWSNGGTTYRLLVCFGCHEMLFSNGKHALLADIREEAYEQFKEILGKYRDQRPARD